MTDFFSRLMLKIEIGSGSKENTVMKMPIKKSIKRFLVASILVSVGLPVIIVGCKKIVFYSSTQMHTFFTATEVSVIMHGIDNPELIKKIHHFIDHKIVKKSLLTTAPTELIIMLSDAFPVIKKITYQYQPPQTILFTLIGTKPTCLVNDHLVIGDHRTLVPKESFAAAALTGLPKITIDTCWLTNGASPDLHAFVHQLTPYHWDNFNIHYRAPWDIQLTPYKSICKATILATEHSIFETKKFTAIAAIFKDLCVRGIITKKVLEAKNCPLLFDTRIQDQVIVRCNQPAKRGRGHG